MVWNQLVGRFYMDSMGEFEEDGSVFRKKGFFTLRNVGSPFLRPDTLPFCISVIKPYFNVYISINVYWYLSPSTVMVFCSWFNLFQTIGNRNNRSSNYSGTPWMLTDEKSIQLVRPLCNLEARCGKVGNRRTLVTTGQGWTGTTPHGPRKLHVQLPNNSKNPHLQ